MNVASQGGSGPLSAPWSRQRTVLLLLSAGVLVAFLLSWRAIGIGVVPLFSGVGQIVSFLGQAVPPEFPALGHTLYLAAITVCTAVLGTAVGVVLSVPAAFMAAFNTTPHAAVRWVARCFIVACRSVPALVIAIVLVEALGIGILPGVLALGLHSVGMVGKLYAQVIEDSPPGPSQAVASTGARKTQVVTTSIVPHFSPAFWSTALYSLDINVRNSVVLGYVGAGGIGVLLNEDMGLLEWQQACGVVLIIWVLVVLMELCSAFVRRSLIGLERPGGADRARRRGPRRAGPPAVYAQGRPAGARASPGDVNRPVRPPWTADRVMRLGLFAAAVGIVAVSFWATGTTPWQPFERLGQVWRTVSLYFPPNFQTARSTLVSGTGQAAAVALLATVVGCLVAVPVGLLAARNVASRRTAFGTRLALVALRAVPELVLAIVFVVAMGLGLAAGAFALTVGTVAIMAKLTADDIEAVPAMPREAVLSAGATRSQEVATSVIAPSVPALVGTAFYMFDINLRSSTVLGLVGGGGIGLLLQESVNILAYRTTGAIIVITFVMVLAVEALTVLVRKQLGAGTATLELSF